MDEMLRCLESANIETTRLFFVTRKKNQNTREISYQVLNSRIRIEIAEELKSYAQIQISAIRSHDFELISYGVISQSDRRIVETIPLQDVPYLNHILNALSLPPDENLLTTEDFPKIWGYIVKINCQNNTLVLFRKYSPKKLLEKGKIACIIRSDQFEKLNDQVITLDSSYDAAILLPNNESENQTRIDPSVIIFNRTWFESFFSFIDVYRQEVDANQGYLNEQDLIDNVAEMTQICSSDSRAIRKLAKILHNRYLDSLNPTRIREVIRDYSLPVVINDQGKIQVSHDHLWIILRILNDDYVKSEITDVKYEARSKIRK